MKQIVFAALLTINAMPAAAKDDRVDDFVDTMTLYERPIALANIALDCKLRSSEWQDIFYEFINQEGNDLQKKYNLSRDEKLLGSKIVNEGILAEQLHINRPDCFLKNDKPLLGLLDAYHDLLSQQLSKER